MEQLTKIQILEFVNKGVTFDEIIGFIMVMKDFRLPNGNLAFNTVDYYRFDDYIEFLQKEEIKLTETRS